MKNIASILFLSTILSMAFSCSNKSTAPVKDSSELEGTDKIPSEVATSVYDKATITKEGVPQMGDLKEDCHGKRKVNQTLEEVEGAILKIGDRFVISTDNGNSRYNPCKLSEKLKKDGILVRFSGEVLEIFPGERLYATPFRLKNIVERDN